LRFPDLSRPVRNSSRRSNDTVESISPFTHIVGELKGFGIGVFNVILQ
jgi:hypothetical protein